MLMKDKFVVVYRMKNTKEPTTKIYKSYRDIALGTGEDYFDVRAIHKMGNGTMIKKFVHEKLRKLQGRMQIHDI